MVEDMVTALSRKIYPLTIETGNGEGNPPESGLTNQFEPCYEGYQRRVGEMIMKQHRKVFG